VADSTGSPGDSAGLHVIRCAECHALVPADRVRHREERVRTRSAPAPGRWRAGGPPLFRGQTQSRHLIHSSGAQTQLAPALRNGPAIERVPVCVDCLSRQKVALCGVCSIAAACCAVAMALYWGEAPGNEQQVPLVRLEDRPNPPPQSMATPTPALLPIASAAAGSAKDKAGDPPPIWQPILDAAANLLAAASAGPPPIPEPIPAPSATPEAAPPSLAVASLRPAAAPIGPIPTAEPTPSRATTEEAASVPSASVPDADVSEASGSAQPIWATKGKQTRKPVKTVPAGRRDVPAAANVVAMRNGGYAALQERRYPEALILLQHATMMGDPYAPMYIGQIFEKGIGVPRDVGQASYWYGIAIDRGNGAAVAAFNRLRVNPY
jgi:hypothetical protein